jgi:3-dehydroquinate dehydratase-2
MAKPLIFVLNGPNLNMLGIREPELYGTQTLADVEALCEEEARRLGVEVACRQTNHEGFLVDWIQESHGNAMGVVINAGAYARTSLAIHTAVKSVSTPVIEVHITNIYNKESYRPPSYLSHVARGVICGLGLDVYRLGIQAVCHLASEEKKP